LCFSPSALLLLSSHLLMFSSSAPVYGARDRREAHGGQTHANLTSVLTTPSFLISRIRQSRSQSRYASRPTSPRSCSWPSTRLRPTCTLRARPFR
jgi:hypothetical protein